MSNQQHGSPMAQDRPGLRQYQGAQSRTLYVGNLDAQMTEVFLSAVFSNCGQVKVCKIIQDPTADPYGFVEFWDPGVAATALAFMDKRVCFGKEMKVNWATSPHDQPRIDISKHFHVFAGDLSPETDTEALRVAFAPFGEISDCRVLVDPVSQKSKGYGFISFAKKADAESAILGMNGQWLGTRGIRTNWATRNVPGPGSREEYGHPNPNNSSFEMVFNQSTPTNMTVYCGGLADGVNEAALETKFSLFGQILEIRLFKGKGYAFIKFATKESATQAIIAINNKEINGQIVKCSWGKVLDDPVQQYTHGLMAGATQYGNPNMYGQQNLGYWGYPQLTGYPLFQAPDLAPEAYGYNSYGYPRDHDQRYWGGGQQGMQSLMGQEPAQTGVRNPTVVAEMLAASYLQQQLQKK